MLGAKWTGLVSKVSNRYIGKVVRHFNSTDDTVEGQSKAFRVWMLSSSGAILLMLILSFASFKGTNSSDESVKKFETSLVERVPEGFVLVPIDPQNIETIDALVDDHAYVDLYSSDSEDQSLGQKNRRAIARGLPMVRAPKNPSRFAVLVMESETRVLTRLGAPVLVVIRKGPLKRQARNKGEPKNPSAKLKQVFEFITEDVPSSVSHNENAEVAI